jgi:hypothetical protein
MKYGKTAIYIEWLTELKQTAQRHNQEVKGVATRRI